MDQKLLSEGYAVIPNLLTQDQMNDLIKTYNHIEQKAHTSSTVIPLGEKAVKEKLGRMIDSILRKVRSEQFHPDTYGAGAFFPTQRGINFGWHQEHTFHWYQTHRHYLHIFIPIIKPDPSKGNLSIVPADAWHNKDPDIWKRIEWGGSMRAIDDPADPSVTKLMDDWQDNCMATLPYKLDDIAATPHLKAGDALLMRGDLFHRTQDNETARVALSIRVWCEEVPLSLSHLQVSFKSTHFPYQKHRRTHWKGFDWAAMEEILTRHEKLQDQQLDEVPITYGEARRQIKIVQCLRPLVETDDICCIC